MGLSININKILLKINKEAKNMAKGMKKVCMEILENLN
jgi:hypothetical protein